MNAAEMLERAADVMERRGKCEGVGEDRFGRVCVIGAIAHVCDARYGVHGWTLQEITPRLRAAFGCVTSWSDNNDQATVIAGLRAVAATLRAQDNTMPREHLYKQRLRVSRIRSFLNEHLHLSR